MTKLILGCLLLIGSVSAQAYSTEKRIAGAHHELSKFRSESVPLPKKYVFGFANWIEQDLRAIEAQVERKSSGCEVKMDVDFFVNNQPDIPEVIRTFEKDLLKIDIQLCFEGTTPQAVVQLANDNEFMRKNISTIRSVSQNEELTCHKTQVTSIGESHYCYAVEKRESRDFSSIMTYNVWNSSDEKYDAPVYFRQIMVGAKRVSQGTVAFRSVTYVRGPDLNAFQRMLSRRVLISEQHMIYEKMKAELWSN